VTKIGDTVALKVPADSTWYHADRQRVAVGTVGTVIALPPPVTGRRHHFVLVESTRPDGAKDRFAAWPEELNHVRR
jgi:hypothetical protein